MHTEYDEYHIPRTRSRSLHLHTLPYLRNVLECFVGMICPEMVTERLLVTIKEIYTIILPDDKMIHSFYDIMIGVAFLKYFKVD